MMTGLSLLLFASFLSFFLFAAGFGACGCHFGLHFFHELLLSLLNRIGQQVHYLFMLVLLGPVCGGESEVIPYVQIHFYTK